MSISRRKFLGQSALTAVGGMLIPSFLKGFDGRNTLLNNSSNKLVIIQFSGGNDGLNTIVPYQNDIYYQQRPNIAIKKSDVIKVTDELGFHPALKSLQGLYDNGDMSIINNVGYPNPDRSHFRSMDIWHTASNSNEYLSTGWLGRYLDKHNNNNHQALEMDDTLSLALKGIEHSGFAMSDPKRLQRTVKTPIVKALVKHHHDHDHEENVAYLYQTLANTVSSSDYLFEKAKTYSSSQSYPKNKLGKSLKQVAELIISGCDTQVYYVTLGGFDTHANQTMTQERLLKAYAESVSAFIKDLKQHNQWNDTMVMTFSEFGRRVKENGSRGTDHGTAGNLFLMSGKLKKAGFYNDAPDLTTLDKGDLIYNMDFRRVYATLLDKWLKVDDQAILNRQFKALSIV
ncbi:MAG: DUF1501 domain-containing protein [Aureispira sp.]|nr:DUF1501 domain-containing protein [Aureispira sp.]